MMINSTCDEVRMYSLHIAKGNYTYGMIHGSNTWLFTTTTNGISFQGCVTLNVSVLPAAILGASKLDSKSGIPFINDHMLGEVERDGPVVDLATSCNLCRPVRVRVSPEYGPVDVVHIPTCIARANMELDAFREIGEVIVCAPVDPILRRME